MIFLVVLLPPTLANAGLLRNCYMVNYDLVGDKILELVRADVRVVDTTVDYEDAVLVSLEELAF